MPAFRLPEEPSGDQKRKITSADNAEERRKGAESTYRPLFYLDSEISLDKNDEDEEDGQLKKSLTTEETVLNTELNKRLVTDEGEAIRKQISLSGEVPVDEVNNSNSSSSNSVLLAPPPPPALCIEPPTPQPIEDCGLEEVEPESASKLGTSGFIPLRRARHRSEGSASSSTVESFLNEDASATTRQRQRQQQWQQQQQQQKRRIRHRQRVRSVSESDTASSSSPPGFARI